MKKILIIEDEAAYVKLLHDQLTTAGYEVEDAKDGKEGLLMAQKIKPDLILLDIRMPVMDGMTVLNLIRKDESIKSTKIIMLTNVEPDEKILGGVVKNHPTFYFIKSDIQIHTLLDKVKELLAD